jgi:hypothetical protein
MVWLATQSNTEEAYTKETLYHLSFLLSPSILSCKYSTSPLFMSFYTRSTSELKHHIEDIPLLERATLFVAPLKADIQILSSIFHDFGDVIDLCTNFQ